MPLILKAFLCVFLVSWALSSILSGMSGCITSMSLVGDEGHQAEFSWWKFCITGWRQPEVLLWFTNVFHFRVARLSPEAGMG